MRRLFLFSIVFLPLGCGPDLSPEKYVVKSIVSNTFEEYTFNYFGNKMQSVLGTDSTTLTYTYFKDSTSIRLINKKSEIVRYTTLAYSGSSLTEVKIRWASSKQWYKDSVQLDYIAGILARINYKNATYQVTMQNGNLIGLRRGNGNLSVTYAMTYDGVTNPLNLVYWHDALITPSGTSATLQPNALARFFSKNNLSTSAGSILGVKETQRFTYTYLKGILPKSIDQEIETSRTKLSGLIFIADILYMPKANTAP